MVKLKLNGESVASLGWELGGEGDFFHGGRVLTTLQIIGKRMVDFDRHIERLTSDAEVLGIDDAPTKEVWHFDIQSLIEDSLISKYYRARLFLFKDRLGKTQRLVAVQSLPPRSSDMPDPIHLAPVVDKSWPRGSQIKTGIIGRRQVELSSARSSGFHDVLWINAEQEVAEATWANVFFIGRTGDLVEIATPPESSGILPGVTRARIMDLLNNARIPVTVRTISSDEIPRFDEAFTTSSIQGLVPVTLIGRHTLPTLRKSAVFRHIHHLYETWLSLDNDYEPSHSKGVMLV